ncbi:hypothetical protein PR003_g24181 [Phytophthora rubi]|uniref:Uncharacterized protein n=1 Tax=Phytophthora rubi TaxID=129364 RepID=A0A6A3IMD0_9STRA|nr:hypothetical protein PR002_g24035 [Phytophthora rubi]KAE8981821.1 hypothetical protein PR001_g23895 [Phytophthora rubi]KAE9294784.1 hypothetical protein PR003_g24181 [Phytophthora rubi]
MERPRGLLRTLAQPSASSSDLLSGPSVSDPSVGDLSISDNQDTTIACTFRPLAQADELSGCSGGSHSPRLAQYASRESTLPPPERHEYHHADEEKFEDVVESSERADALLTGHDFVRASASADATSLYPELDSITLGDVEVIVEEIASSERGDDHSEQHAGLVQNEKKMFLCIKGLPGSSFKYKQLRFLCKKLGVHGYKNKTKAAMIDLIIQRKINEASYDALFEKKKKARSDPPQKQKQCPFRLLNVLFSDEFAGRLSSLGDTRLRADLNASMPPEVVFWRDVEVAFKDSDNVAYGRLAFQDMHPALEELDGNPAIIVNHCAEKLQ